MTAPRLERGAGRGRTLYLDAQSGIAGDMTIAALVHLGVPPEVVDASLRGVDLAGYRVEHGWVTRSGIAARRFRVDVAGDQPVRDYAHVRGLLDAAALDDGVRRRAQAIFRRLAEAEADVHRRPLDEVHFHEVGAVDSIVDIVGVAALLEHLAPDRIVVSPLPLGRGFTPSDHGVLPLPAPATLHCLRGIPTYDAGVDMELVTPTGAAIVATQADDFGGWPSMRPLRTGWGGGSREVPDRPNVLRAVLGDPVDTTPGPSRSAATHVLVEANLDDAPGEWVGHALARLFEAGALDAWTTAIGMKKSRPGVRLAALAPREHGDAVARAMLTETSTLGVRLIACDRVERPRRVVHVTTPWGEVPVKIADGDGLPANVAPEYEACRALAEAAGVPLRQVMAAASAAGLRALGA